jgi:hypothetical protein
VLSRPNGVSPWIVANVTQGFHLREAINMTITLSDIEGHLLASKSKDSYDGTLITLNVDIDYISANVTYDFTAGTLTIK